MKKIFLFLPAAVAAGTGAGVFVSAQNRTETDMACCTIADLRAAYGEDRVAGWPRLNPDTADRAITDAGTGIDGCLLPGGCAVPLPGASANIKKYAVGIASANLVLSAGVLDSDPGGKAVLNQAETARKYLTKAAEGKFMIPGYGAEDEVSKPPGGNARTRTEPKPDWRGY